MDYSVNVLQFAEARASEIASLMDDINSSDNKKKSWFQRLPHYMRRRGASQNPKRVPRKLREQSKQGKPEDTRKSKKKPFKKSVKKDSLDKPAQNTWLETHVWHAKRFKMETLWDYRIPIHSTDKKLGTSHRAAANRCMIEDLSYYCCIELIGKIYDLESKISCLSDNATGHTFTSRMFFDGSKEGYCFLYHPYSYPYKAIGPVTFLWEPEPFLSSCEKDMVKEVTGERRKLWIWCHPSIHDELTQVLISILHLSKCDEDSEPTSPSESNRKRRKLPLRKEECYISDPKERISMNLLRNALARHRLIGPMSLPILSRVLRVAGACKSSNAEKLKMSDSLWWTYYLNHETYMNMHADQTRLWNCLNDVQASYYVPPRSVIGLTVRDPRNSCAWSRESSTVDGDEGDSVSLLKLDELFTPYVSMSPLWYDDIRKEVTATKLSEHTINEERSKCIVPPDLGERENRIPVIIIHHPALNGFASSWDLIAPVGWSQEFWRSYERNGALAAGLRDLHFVNLEAGRPNFPCSFPDTVASVQAGEALRQRSLTELFRHPKNQRPNFSALAIPTPFFMDWETLVKDWELESRNPASILQRVFKNCNVKFENLECCIENGSNALNADMESNNLALPKDGLKKFYVLRDMDGLSQLWDHACKAFRKSGSELEKLKAHIDSFTENSLKSPFVTEKECRVRDRKKLSLKAQAQFMQSLILVKIKCLNKGTPSTHASLYLLSDDDLAELRNNPKFSGPVEPNHSEKQSVLQGEGKCSNGVKSKSKNQKIADYLERPETVIQSSTRNMIGYLSEGGFSSICGHGIGIGHCTSIGFLVMLRQCAEFQMRPVILWRNQHSFQFRIANIEPIENYL